MSSNQHRWAMDLTLCGYSIFPIYPDTKIPALPWRENSSASRAQANKWWMFYPDDNIGINTGESGLLVIDLDSEDALDTWDTLWDRHERRSFDDGRFPVVRTRRGWHIYMDSDGRDFKNSAGKLGTGIDTRGRGGMVLGPGSRVKGVEYDLEVGSINDIGAVPAWLTKKLIKPKTLARDPRQSQAWRPPTKYKSEQELRRWCMRIETAAHGQQNTTINTAAFVLSRDYMPPLDVEDVRGELLAACERGHHPMSRARATIDSGLGFHS